jgi:hypothetical protein
MPALPQSNIHLDILMGRDESLDVSDFFGGGSLVNSLDPIPYLPKSRKVWKVSHRWTSTAIWRRCGCNITRRKLRSHQTHGVRTLVAFPLTCRRYDQRRRSQLVLRVCYLGPTTYVMWVIVRVPRKQIVPFARLSRAQAQTRVTVTVLQNRGCRRNVART